MQLYGAKTVMFIKILYIDRMDWGAGQMPGGAGAGHLLAFVDKNCPQGLEMTRTLFL